MADYGATYTDKKIIDLDKEIQEVYKEAEKDIQKKMDDFNAKYKIKEQKYQQKVDSGQMTQEEFDRWKKGQVFQGQQWQAKKDQILDTMHHSNEIATKIINGQSQNIFMVNANYMSYDIEHGAGVNFGFGLYDQNTVANLIADDPKLLPEWKINEKKDYIWSQKKLNNAITQGIIQGESLDKISKRISDKLASTNENKMKTFARTAMTGAQNSGRQMQLENAQKLDIEVQKEWMATLDARTRDSHKDMDGEKVDVDKEFSNGLMFPGDPNGAPAETYNCFIPETSVASDSEIIRSYKHWYSGKVVSIKSAGGVNFTCTPNHPILTDRGWIAAKFLNEGDHLIVTSGINNEISRRNPNINHAFPAINTIHQLFDKIGGERTSVLGVNFHGDVATSDVEVITQKRFLGTNFDTGTGKSVNKFLLKYTNTSFMRKSSFMEHFRRIVRSSFSNISSISKPFSFISRSLRHSNIHRFGAVSDVNLSISEYSINDLPTNPDFFGESLIGLTGKIFLDDIISVDISDFTGHVYNLQTKNNYYFVNNNTNNTKLYNSIFAIAHNCRCTMVSDVKKYPSSYNRYDNISGQKIKNMSYKEWVKAKGMEKKSKPVASKPVFTVVNGKDILQTWERRPDKFDFEIEDVINAQGFDGLPRVVNAKEFDKYVKESNLLMERGFTAPTQEALDLYKKELREGKFYVDVRKEDIDAWGGGMYTTPNFNGIEDERMHKISYEFYGKGRGGNPYGTVEKMTMTKDARVVTFDDIKNQYNEYKKSTMSMADPAVDKAKYDKFVFSKYESKISQGNTEKARAFFDFQTGNSSISFDEAADIRSKLTDEDRQIIKEMVKESNTPSLMTKFFEKNSNDEKYGFNDIGAFAAAHGYDAIYLKEGALGTPELIVFNRTKLIIKGE